LVKSGLSITPAPPHQLGQRHQLAVGGAHRQRQQRIQPHLALARQLQPHRHRVLGLAVVQVGGVHARQRGLHRLRHLATGMPSDSARWRCTRRKARGASARSVVSMPTMSGVSREGLGDTRAASCWRPASSGP
jgi:hypothetical protein